MDKLDLILDKINFMDEKIDNVIVKVDDMGKRIDALEARFDDMDKRIDVLEARFDDMDKRIDALEARFDDMDKRIDKLEEHISSIDTDVKSVKVILENEVRENIMRVAEGHLDLSRNLKDAIKSNNEFEILTVKVNMLESDVNELKRKIS